jgi:lipoprotein-anchoring transpeptidase ErfK/SrfK
MKWLFLFLAFIFSFFLFPKTVSAAEIITDGKLITVDIGKQMLYAWEGGKIIHQTKISSGLPKTPTVKGSFKIRWKVPKQRMKGESAWYGKYDYKNVPHVMYFYQDYAIHGAYWHNKFGRPNSHGCVNVPLASAEWLYNWAEKGTRVEIF